MAIGGSSLSANFTQTIIDEATLFFANTDITGAEAETLTDGSDASALHTHTGLVASDIATSGFTTAGVNVGELVRGSADNTVLAAIATAQSTANVLGVVLSAGVVTTDGIMSIVGDDGSDPGVGVVVFLETATAGRWTATAPSGSGEVVAPIGVVVDDSAYAATAGNTAEIRLNVQRTLLLA